MLKTLKKPENVYWSVKLNESVYTQNPNVQILIQFSLLRWLVLPALEFSHIEHLEVVFPQISCTEFRRCSEKLKSCSQNDFHYFITSLTSLVFQYIAVL